MASCTICGEKTSIFKKLHKECEEKVAVGWAQMVEISCNAIATGEYCDGELVSSLQNLATSNLIPSSDIRKSIMQGWIRRLDDALEDGLLSDEEEASLSSALDFFTVKAVPLNFLI